MATNNDTEISRLVFLASGLICTLELIVSKLRNGFVDGNDYLETRRTLDRLKLETDGLKGEIEAKEPLT